MGITSSSPQWTSSTQNITHVPPNQYPDEFSGSSSSYVFHSSQAPLSFTATPHTSTEKSPRSNTASFTETWNKYYTVRFPSTSTSDAYDNPEDSQSVMDKPTIIALTFSGLLLLLVLLLLVVLTVRRKRRNKTIDNTRVFHTKDLPHGCYSTVISGTGSGVYNQVQKSNNEIITNGTTNVDDNVYDAVYSGHEISQGGARPSENVTFSNNGKVNVSGNHQETQEGYLIPDRVLSERYPADYSQYVSII